MRTAAQRTIGPSDSPSKPKGVSSPYSIMRKWLLHEALWHRVGGRMAQRKQVQKDMVRARDNRR